VKKGPQQPKEKETEYPLLLRIGNFYIHIFSTVLHFSLRQLLPTTHPFSRAFVPRPSALLRQTSQSPSAESVIILSIPENLQP